MLENNRYRIIELINKLNEATDEYDKGTPVMSDKEWDTLYFELKELEEKTGIIYPYSPTQTVHYEMVPSLGKITHDHPMLSLDKTKDLSEIEKFVRGNDWCAMFKMDGLTCSLTYEKGKLVQAETRGNGVIGEDILHNVRVIKNIPQQIPVTDEKIVIDGEIICTLHDFEEFKDEYKNPRNFAAGSIRLLDSKVAATRKLSFIAWDLVKGCDDIDFFIWRLEKLNDWGFTVVPTIGDAETVEDAVAFLDNTISRSLYPIDGYVFKFMSVKYGKSLGFTDHHAKNAIAYKFYDELYDTTLKYIDWTMGRTGILTPVAVCEPVEIDGSVVERCSLHNYSVMRDILGPCAYVGEPLKIFKANMIIPQIAEAGPKYTFGEVVAAGGIFADDELEYCPCCGSAVKIETSAGGVKNVVCTNPNCEGKLINRIDHFCGKKGLDIKGISKKTIEKLINWGWLNGIGDIFKLSQYRTNWVAKKGFGESSVGKILDAINDTKREVSLISFISALGVPLVGRTVAKTIVSHYSTWEEFRKASTKGIDWTQYEGLGPEISYQINRFDYTEADEIAEMLTFKEPEIQSEEEQSAAIKDKTFCVTGKLKLFKNRDELKAEIESLGGRVTGSVTSKTDYLINNDINSTTAKNKTAKNLNIPIITEEDYVKLKSSQT